MTEADKTAAVEVPAAEPVTMSEMKEEAAHEDAEPSLEERARALVASYERGMETNSPRTMTELNELRALLLG